MRSLVLAGRNLLGTFRKDEEGQDAFEYLLVIGVIMIGIVGAAATGIGPGGIVDTIVSNITSGIADLFT